MSLEKETLVVDYILANGEEGQTVILAYINADKQRILHRIAETLTTKVVVEDYTIKSRYPHAA